MVLSFAGSWFFPLLTSVVAGDVFSAEDRLGTWRHLLVAVRSPRRIFIAKALASLTVLLMCVPGLAISGMVGGLVVGSRPLTGLDGHLLSPADAAGNSCSPGSACSPRYWPSPRSGCSPPSSSGAPRSGCCCPPSADWECNSSQMLPMPVAVRLALPGFAFLSWNGLFTSPPQLGSLLPASPSAWRGPYRDRAGLRAVHAARLHQPGERRLVRRAITFGILPLLGVGPFPPGRGRGDRGHGSGITQQAAAVARHVVRPPYACRASSSTTRPSLRRSCGSRRHAPRGTAWSPRTGRERLALRVYWHLPGTACTGQAVYQLDVNPNGRYVADGDGPNQVNGYFLMHAPTGDAPNPLWQFDGNVELLSPRRRDTACKSRRQRRKVSRVRVGSPGLGRGPPTSHRRRRHSSCADRRRGDDRLRLDGGLRRATRSARSTPMGSRGSPTTRSSSRSVTACSPSSVSSWVGRPRSARTGDSSPRPPPTIRWSCRSSTCRATSSSGRSAA